MMCNKGQEFNVTNDICLKCDNFRECSFFKTFKELENKSLNIPKILGVTDKGKFQIEYTEIKEIALSQNKNSKYYKGDKITENEVKDFQITLGLVNTIDDIINIIRRY